MSTSERVDPLEREAGPDHTEHVPRYYIDLEFAESQGRSMAYLIALRKCSDSRRKDTEKTIARSKPTTHIRRISQHCHKAEDFLPPDTPLKEAIFKVLLAEGNREMTADEISTVLTARWALSTNRRDISARVIQGLLDSSESYGIVRVPEPEPESEPEPEPEEIEALPVAQTQDAEEVGAPDVAEAGEQTAAEAEEVGSTESQDTASAAQEPAEE